MHKCMALWIRGCLINVRIQSIAQPHVTEGALSTPHPLCLTPSCSSTLLTFLSISCHLLFLCPSPSFPLLILLFISPCRCPKVTKGTRYILHNHHGSIPAAQTWDKNAACGVENNKSFDITKNMTWKRLPSTCCIFCVCCRYRAFMSCYCSIFDLMFLFFNVFSGDDFFLCLIMLLKCFSSWFKHVNDWKFIFKILYKFIFFCKTF